MSKRSSLAALVAASVLILPGFAAAADCPLSNAVYADRDGTYQLKFSPLNSDAAAASNQFKMTVKDSKAVLDGYVMKKLLALLTSAAAATCSTPSSRIFL